MRTLIKITKKTFAIVKQQAAFLLGCTFARAGNGADDQQSGWKIWFKPMCLESRKTKEEEEEEEKEKYDSNADISNIQIRRPGRILTHTHTSVHVHTWLQCYRW